VTGFSKILIANRGEIACRIIRTARVLGYQTVAVYSDADRLSPHVEQADEAVHIGGSAAADSYLNVEALLEAARKTGADAVHPGYGFLSENASFARSVVDHGLVFIGPSADAMEAMGDKARAKRRMMAAGVPCAPGYLGEEQASERLTEEALKLGFPLLVKAVAGGGGRGMRLVRSASEIPQAIADAQREARSSFGDGTLMLERLIENGRHIEIQIFADAHGQAIHLGERDCTAQRRRQKVIEEAPSPVVSVAMREAMGKDAVAAALAVGYCGAGTIEFILDAQFNHYFLEMNTRLQVEHPVTEMITGFDLVAWQIQIAAGRPLPVQQADVQLSGHAIEVRLCAEDPYAGFAPQTGTICRWRPQEALQSGIRIDDGIVEGSIVSPFYDPLMAKIIAHGHDRDDAIRRLRTAMAKTPLLGVRNNGQFLSDVLNSSHFRDSAMTTATLDQWLENDEPLLRRPQPDDDVWCLAAAVFAMQGGAGWRPVGVASYDLFLRCDSSVRNLRVSPDHNGRVTVAREGAERTIRLDLRAEGRLHYDMEGVTRQALFVMSGENLHMATGVASFVFHEVSPFPQVDTKSDAAQVLAPVAGKVSQMLVAVGDSVTEGQALMCVEAMKMEMWLTAQGAGQVVAVHSLVGEQVMSGALVIELRVHEASQAGSSEP